MRSKFSTILFITIISAVFSTGFLENAEYNINSPAGTWIQGSQVISTRSDACGAYWQNDTMGYLFFLGGSSGTIQSFNDRYNVITNTWQRLAPMPVPTRNSAAVCLGNYMYVTGGMLSNALSNSTDTCQKYNIITNTWSFAADMPQKLAMHRVVAYQDSLIYSIGGLSPAGLDGVNSIYLYNAATNTWRNATPLPQGNLNFGCTIYGDTIIVICGTTNYLSGFTNAVKRGIISQTDRSQITWSSGVNYPGLARVYIEAVPWGDKGIIMGPGKHNGGYTSECYVYFNNVWMSQPNVPSVTCWPATGIFKFGRIGKYIIAGGINMSLNTQIYSDSVFNLSPPPAPDLISPLNNSQGQSMTPLMDWDSLPSAVSYRIQITATDSVNFTSTAFDTSGLTSTFITVPASKLSNNTKYWWRVNAQNSAGEGPWSDIYNFKTLITGISYNNEIPVSFKLYDNFPNPFNPSTIFKYDIPAFSNVKIIIYDLLGRELSVFLNENKEPGKYEIKFDAGKLASGIYFYRITAGDFVETKKMLLLK